MDISTNMIHNGSEHTSFQILFHIFSSCSYLIDSLVRPAHSLHALRLHADKGHIASKPDSQRECAADIRSHTSSNDKLCLKSNQPSLLVL